MWTADGHLEQNYDHSMLRSKTPVRASSPSLPLKLPTNNKWSLPQAYYSCCSAAFPPEGVYNKQQSDVLCYQLYGVHSTSAQLRAGHMYIVLLAPVHESCHNLLRDGW